MVVIPIINNGSVPKTCRYLFGGECPTRFNRDYPQPYQAGIERFIPFTEDINRIVSQLNHH